uniref:Uncharacterized protein n=1 Tax=Meloidogyne enterolobii TaxID=390850 RepID=A0A6V7XBZ9_MELEN|nr:unnamed protein product [Meloidogyne enterolobii]
MLLIFLSNIFNYFLFKQLIKSSPPSYPSHSPHKITRHSALIITFLLLIQSISSTKTNLCHSCLAQCKLIEGGKIDPNKCDCGGNNDNDNETCIAENCFVKIELFLEEMIGIVQVN